MPRIHPTAIVASDAVIGDDVEIGAHAVVESDVTIGALSVLREGAIIRRYTTLGCGNFVDSHAVLGGLPQDLKFDPRSATYLKIGDNNVFRESVTISRGTKPGGATSIGSRGYWMTTAHAGHDCIIGDDVILVNGVALAGHVEVGNRAILSAHVSVHQFCRIGEMCIAQGNGILTQHMPPYCMWAGAGDVVGLNNVGLRRAVHIDDVDRHQVKEAFVLLFRKGLNPGQALAEMDARSEWKVAASKFRDFVRQALAATKPYNRGLAKLRSIQARVGQKNAKSAAIWRPSWND